MNVIILGPLWRNEEIVNVLKRKGVNVVLSESYELLKEGHEFTHLISSGFNLKIPELILNQFEKRKRINLHASYLPFGKGIGTLLYPFIYPVPIGISAHVLDPKVDMGEILVQERIYLETKELTQREVHQKFVAYANDFFKRHLLDLLNCQTALIEQPRNYVVPYAKRNHSEMHLSLLPEGWDSKIKDLNRLGLAVALRHAYNNIKEIGE